jgi:thioredoxin reductase (NADPH)
MAKHAMEHPKIEILWDTVLTEVKGTDVVESVTLQNVKTKSQETREAAGVFFAIGHLPNTGFLEGQLSTDEHGYLSVKPGSTLTNVDGVFAAGDVQDKVYRQAISAAGSGCMAALDAERWLSANGMS